MLLILEGFSPSSYQCSKRHQIVDAQKQNSLQTRDQINFSMMISILLTFCVDNPTVLFSFVTEFGVPDKKLIYGNNPKASLHSTSCMFASSSKNYMKF